MGLPQSRTDALSQTIQIEYDTQNNPITATDELGRQTISVYDEHNNLLHRTTHITAAFPQGLTTMYTYNVRYPGKHWLEDVRQPDGVVTHYEYDQLGQLTTTTLGYGTPFAQVTTYEYDSVGRMVASTIGAGTALAHRDVTNYNPDNTIAHTIQNYKDGVFDPARPDEDIPTTYGYDHLGRPVWVRDALGHYDVTHYDTAGHVGWRSHNLGPLQLDPQGQPIIQPFDPAHPDANVTTFFGYDGLNRIVLVTETGILTGTFNPTTRTFDDATVRITRTEYDSLNRPITTTLNYHPDRPIGILPDVNTQLVTRYDLAGNVTWKRDELGRWIYTEYDALNRPVKITMNYENDDPLTVDPENRLWTDGTDTDLITVLRYTPDGQIEREIDNYVDGVFTVTEPITDRITLYTYDTLGRVTTTTRNYDPATLGSRSDTNRTSAILYDPANGRVIGEQDALGRWESRQYDARGRLALTIRNCRDTQGNPAVQDCAPFAPINTPDRNVPMWTRYDPLGRVFEQVDALDHVTHMILDGVGRITTTIQNYVAGGPANADTNVTTSLTYDPLGRVIAATDPMGAITRSGYDGLGRVISLTDSQARVTRSSYDITNSQRWTQGPDGHLKVAYIDGLGRVVSVIDNYQNGVVDSHEQVDQDLRTLTFYDMAGRVVRTIDPAGRVTVFGYDLHNRLIQVQENVQTGSCNLPPCNVLTRYHYDRLGNRTALTDPRGNTQHYHYDAADQQISTIDAVGRETMWEYDAQGRMVAQHDPRGNTDDLLVRYDESNHVTEVLAQNLPAPIRAQYDALGRRTNLVDATGTTNFLYDALGRILQVHAPETGTVEYGYDALGRRTQLRYPNGPTIGYEYWSDGHLRTVQENSTPLAEYSYDAEGQLAQITRGNSTVTNYGYDSAGRLHDISTLVNGTLLSRFEYQVNRLGMRTAITETLPLIPSDTTPPSETCALYPIALDTQSLIGVSPGQIIPDISNGTRAGNFGWLTWAGSPSEPTFVTSLTPPGDSATYVNPTHPNDHVVSVNDWVQGKAGVSNSQAVRTALDRLKSIDITIPVWDRAKGNGNTATYRITNFARVRITEYQLPGQNRISMRFLGYATCGIGRPPLQHQTRTITYAYDGLQRLIDAVEHTGASYHYAYDLAGNQTEAYVNSVRTESRSYDAANQIVGWQYDAVGNLLNDGTATYTYDALNRPLTVTTANQQRSYDYNGDGGLVAQTANSLRTRYTQDEASSLSQILQSTQGSVTTNYLYGLDRIAATGTARIWYGDDALGSIRLTLDDGGTPLNTFNYDPWGTPEDGATPDRFGFTGEFQDTAIGLIYLRARWYRPDQGRFVSRDFWHGDVGRPMSFNKYLYADANPVNLTDPSGFDPWWCEGRPDEAQCYASYAGAPKPSIVPRSEWGAMAPGIHVACGPMGACAGTGWAERRYDPVQNPGGYACYAELLPGRPLADILDTVVIHHEGNNESYDPQQVQREHMWGNGWYDVGYHFMIHPNGTIYEGRDIKVRGSHVGGQNTGKVGVLLMGDFQPGPEFTILGITIWKDHDDPRPTVQQENSALSLIRWLDATYGIDVVLGHRQVPGQSTECPGENAMPFIPLFDAAAQER